MRPDVPQAFGHSDATAPGYILCSDAYHWHPLIE